MNIMELDIRTILVLLVFGNVASALTIFVYQRRFGFNPPVMHYLAGVLFQSVAWVLLDVQKLVPAFWSVYVGNALLIVGYNMAAIGLSTVGNQDRRIYRTHALVTVLGIVGFVAFSSTPASQIVAASIAALGAFIGLSVWMLRSPHRTDLKLFIGIASIVYCGILVARAVSAMLAGDNFGLMTPAPIQTIAFVPLVLVSSVGAIGFIIISKETIDARLAESEEKYRSLVERANEGIVIAQDSRFVYVNPKMAELLGTSPAMLIGRLFVEYLWPDDRERILTNHHERLAGGTLAESSDIRIIAADGTPRWLSMSSAIIHWDGRPATLNLISDVDERKRSEEQSARLLAEKSLLLREVHHRIKNNLAVAVSLLSLQAEEARSKDPYEVLLDARGRLQSMMQLYELLNAQASFESVSIRDFLSALTRELTSMFTGSAEVRFLVRVEDFKLGVDRLATLGLIVNEIVTNSLKYAFYETKEPLVSITVTKSDGRITVRCEDNGCGMPVDDARDESHGLGSMLIEMLAGQLRASLRVESDGGTRYTLEFDERAGEP